MWPHPNAWLQDKVITLLLVYTAFPLNTTKYSHTHACVHIHTSNEKLFSNQGGIYKQLQGWDRVQIFIHVLTGSGHTRYLGPNLGEKKIWLILFLFLNLANMIYEKGNLICHCISKVLFTMYH